MIQQEILLTRDECNKVIDLINEKNFQRSKTSDGNGQSSISDYRTSYEITFENNQYLNNLLLPKLEKFGIISLPNTIKLIRYESGQEFKRHTDSGGEYNYRVKSVSIQLSDDYEGGDMFIWGSSVEVPFDKTLGNTIIFNSELPHQVLPIKSGVRYALVFWLSGEHLIPKNTI